jgi:hypothetical protein
VKRALLDTSTLASPLTTRRCQATTPGEARHRPRTDRRDAAHDLPLITRDRDLATVDGLDAVIV